MTTPLEWSNHYGHCATPFQLDPYIGCMHGCVYCYADARGCERRRVGVRVRSGEDLVAELERVWAGGWARAAGEALRHGMALRLGVMGDPLSAVELGHRSTRAILEWAVRRDHPVTVATKGAPLVAEYAPLLARPGGHLQVSFSTLDPVEARRLEPGAPEPAERLRAIEAVARAGGHVTARIAPLIPWLAGAREPARVCGELAASGVRHVMIEHMRLPSARAEAVSAAVGRDMKRLYATGVRGGNQCGLRVEGRVAGVLAWRHAAHAAGLTYGCGDNDLKLANDSISCCGVDLALGRHAVHLPMAQRACEVVREYGAVEFRDIEHDWYPTARINARRTLIREIARDTTALEIARATWRAVGPCQYGLRQLPGHRYELDPTVRLFDSLTRRDGPAARPAAPR